MIVILFLIKCLPFTESTKTDFYREMLLYGQFAFFDLGGNDFDDNVLQDVSSSAEPPEKKKEKSLGRRVGLRGSNTKANKN